MKNFAKMAAAAAVGFLVVGAIFMAINSWQKKKAEEKAAADATAAAAAAAAGGTK